MEKLTLVIILIAPIISFSMDREITTNKIILYQLYQQLETDPESFAVLTRRELHSAISIVKKHQKKTHKRHCTSQCSKVAHILLTVGYGIPAIIVGFCLMQEKQDVEEPLKEEFIRVCSMIFGSCLFFKTLAKLSRPKIMRTEKIKRDQQLIALLEDASKQKE